MREEQATMERVTTTVGEQFDLSSGTITFIRPYNLKLDGESVSVTSATIEVMRGKHEKHLNEMRAKSGVQKVMSELVKSITVSLNNGAIRNRTAVSEAIDSLYEDDRQLMMLCHYALSFAEDATIEGTCESCNTKHVGAEKLNIMSVKIDTTNATVSPLFDLRDGISYNDSIITKAQCVRPASLVYDQLTMDKGNGALIARDLMRRVTRFENNTVVPDRLYDEITTRDKNTILKNYAESFVSNMDIVREVECECGSGVILTIPFTKYLSGE